MDFWLFYNLIEDSLPFPNVRYCCHTNHRLTYAFLSRLSLRLQIWLRTGKYDSSFTHFVQNHWSLNRSTKAEIHSTSVYAYSILNILPKEINLYLFFRKPRWVITKSNGIFVVILYILLRRKKVMIKMLPSFSVCYFKKNMFYVILTFGKFTKPGL